MRQHHLLAAQQIAMDGGRIAVRVHENEWVAHVQMRGRRHRLAVGAAVIGWQEEEATMWKTSNTQYMSKIPENEKLSTGYA